MRSWSTVPGAGADGDGIGAPDAFTTTTDTGEAGRDRIIHLITSIVRARTSIVRARLCGRIVPATAATGHTGRHTIVRRIDRHRDRVIREIVRLHTGRRWAVRALRINQEGRILVVLLRNPTSRGHQIVRRRTDQAHQVILRVKTEQARNAQPSGSGSLNAKSAADSQRKQASASRATVEKAERARLTEPAGSKVFPARAT